MPSNILGEYEDYQRQLYSINKGSIGRAVRMQGLNRLELHGFADASERAFGACIYVRTSKGDDHQSILLCTRSRVAPVRTITLPRLELCAAVLLIKLLNEVKDSLRCQVDLVKLWSDSSIVLSWINSSPHLFTTFLANRVSEIQESSSAEMWRHVASEDNPADAVSRGQMPEDFLRNELWKAGPKWLLLPEECWPSRMFTSPDLPEMRKNVVLNAKHKPSWVEFWNRYSSWQKVVRIMAYCRRFIEILTKRSKVTGRLTANELSAASDSILSLVQQEEFNDEIKELKKNGRVQRGSRLLRLNPIIDG